MNGRPVHRVVTEPHFGACLHAVLDSQRLDQAWSLVQRSRSGHMRRPSPAGPTRVCTSTAERRSAWHCACWEARVTLVRTRSALEW